MGQDAATATATATVHPPTPADSLAPPLSGRGGPLKEDEVPMEEVVDLQKDDDAVVVALRASWEVE